VGFGQTSGQVGQAGAAEDDRLGAVLKLGAFDFRAFAAQQNYTQLAK
jgi:hypothetical protein